MNSSVELELKRALEKARCGILRHKGPSSVSGRHDDAERDWIRLASRGGESGPSLMDILRAVSSATGIAMADLKSPRRRRDVVRARMIYMALARRLTSQSFPMIGRTIGGKDHSTIIHGILKVETRTVDFEPEFSQLLAAFQASGE